MRNPLVDEVCDSRDVIEYLDFLESDIISEYEDYFSEEISEGTKEYIDREDILDLETSEKEFFESYREDILEYMALRDFVNEAEGYSPDFNYGATIISWDHFEEYARELVEEIGDLPKGLPAYIENNIDWEGVADDIKQDYTGIDFDGRTYYIR
jgi:hypothetical protein